MGIDAVITFPDGLPAHIQQEAENRFPELVGGFYFTGGIGDEEVQIQLQPGPRLYSPSYPRGPWPLLRNYLEFFVKYPKLETLYGGGETTGGTSSDPRATPELLEEYSDHWYSEQGIPVSDHGYLTSPAIGMRVVVILGSTVNTVELQGEIVDFYSPESSESPEEIYFLKHTTGEITRFESKNILTWSQIS